MINENLTRDYSLVFTFCSLLATGVACACVIPVCVADIVAVQNCGFYNRDSFQVNWRYSPFSFSCREGVVRNRYHASHNFPGDFFVLEPLWRSSRVDIV